MKAFFTFAALLAVGASLPIAEPLAKVEHHSDLDCRLDGKGHFRDPSCPAAITAAWKATQRLQSEEAKHRNSSAVQERGLRDSRPDLDCRVDEDGHFRDPSCPAAITAVWKAARGLQHANIEASNGRKGANKTAPIAAAVGKSHDAADGKNLDWSETGNVNPNGWSFMNP